MSDEKKPTKSKAKAEPKKTEKAAEKKPPKTAKRVVADGCSLTSKKGILCAGAVVTAEILAGGQEALEAQIKAGNVIEK